MRQWRFPPTFTFVLIFMAALIAACSSIATPTPDPTAQAEAQATADSEFETKTALAFTSWQVESYGGPEDSLPANPDIPATVNFFLTRYAGFGGCNWFLGVYDIGETSMFIRTPSQTRFFCEQTWLEEGTFVSSLLNIIEYKLEDDKLIGYTSNNQQMITLVPAETSPIEGTIWNLAFTSRNGRDAVPLIYETAITAEFSEDQISGHTGCNDFSASFERGPNTLESDQIVSATATVGEVNLVVGEAPCSEPKGFFGTQGCGAQLDPLE